MLSNRCGSPSTPPSRTVERSTRPSWSARQGAGRVRWHSVIAAEMATDFEEVLGQSITSAADLNSILLGGEGQKRRPYRRGPSTQESLPNRPVSRHRSAEALPHGWEKCPKFANRRLHAAFQTTDEYCLLQPLRDRMRLVLRFEFYSVEELTTVLRHRIRCLGWEIEDCLLAMIAARSRGTPRLALRLLASGLPSLPIRR